MKIGIAMVTFDPTDRAYGDSGLTERTNYFIDFISRAERQFTQSGEELALRIFLAPEYFLARREPYSLGFDPSKNSRHIPEVFKPRKRTISQTKFNTFQNNIQKHAENTINPEQNQAKNKAQPKDYLIIAGTALVETSPFSFKRNDNQFKNAVALLMSSDKCESYQKMEEIHELGDPKHLNEIKAYNKHVLQYAGKLVPQELTYQKGDKHGLFTVQAGGHSLTIGLEVCLDHQMKTLAGHLKEQTRKVDVHIILSAPTNTYLDAVCARNNGLVVHCSTEFGDGNLFQDVDEVGENTKVKRWCYAGTNVFQVTTQGKLERVLGKPLPESITEVPTYKKKMLERSKAQVLSNGPTNKRWFPQPSRTVSSSMPPPPPPPSSMPPPPPILAKKEPSYTEQCEQRLKSLETEKSKLGTQEHIWLVNLPPK